VIGDMRATKLTLPSLEHGTGMPYHQAWIRTRLEQTHLWRLIAFAVLLRMEAALESFQDLSLQITNPHVADVMDQVQERVG